MIRMLCSIRFWVRKYVTFSQNCKTIQQARTSQNLPHGNGSKGNVNCPITASNEKIVKASKHWANIYYRHIPAFRIIGKDYLSFTTLLSSKCGKATHRCKICIHECRQFCWSDRIGAAVNQDLDTQPSWFIHPTAPNIGPQVCTQHTLQFWMLPKDMEELFKTQESNHTNARCCLLKSSFMALWILKGWHKHSVAIMSCCRFLKSCQVRHILKNTSKFWYLNRTYD
jgi:hypothetical protein